MRVAIRVFRLMLHVREGEAAAVVTLQDVIQQIKLLGAVVEVVADEVALPHVQIQAIQAIQAMRAILAPVQTQLHLILFL